MTTHAGPGEVRVRVRAAGLNPVDWKVAASPEVAGYFGVTAPAGFGNHFAGVIDEAIAVLRGGHVRGKVVVTV